MRGRNKRQNQRQGCLVPIDAKKGSVFGNAQTVDISSGGLGLIVHKAVSLDEKIAVEIESKPGKGSIMMLGQVVWVEKIARENCYRLGLKFEKAFSPRALEKLKHLCKG